MTTPAAGIDPATEDLSALSWVAGELQRSLDAAHKALRRYLKEAQAIGVSDVDAADTSILRGARVQLHQGVGALELVGLAVPARVMRASEAAVQRMIGKPGLLDEAAVQALENASFAVVDYLHRLLARRPVSGVAMFPQYRAVQQLAGGDRVHPADLWGTTWRWQQLPAEAGVLPRAADDAARSAMESLVLALMRRADAASMSAMSDFCAQLGAGARSSMAATTWRLASAFFDAQSAGLLDSDLYAKRMASRLLAQLRANVRSDEDVSERLATDLLFFCARARHPEDVERRAPRLAVVRRAWQLGDSPALTDYETPRLGRFDPSWIAQARKRVVAAKEVWSAVAGGDARRLSGVSDAFALLGESIERLFPEGHRLSSSLQLAGVNTVAMGSPPSPALAMEVATAVLYLDAALEEGELDAADLGVRVQRLAQRIDEVNAGGDAQPLEPWIEELYRRVSDHQTMGSVVHELRASLTEVEKNIDQYFRDPTQRELLVPVPAQLKAMRGVLSVLDLEQASQAVLHMGHAVDELAATEVDPVHARESGTFDRLADNLGALGFMIDMLSVQPQLARSLFRFDPEAGRLSAVMGLASRPSVFAGLGVDATPEPEPLAEEVQTLAQAAVASDLSDEDLSRQLEQLSQRAVAADQSGLARVASQAQQALGRAADDEARQAARAEIAQAMSELAQPVVAPIAPPPPAPIPELRPAPPGGTGLEDDPEMRGIFIEEAREVIGNAGQALERLASAADNLSDMTEVRRAFHTLKGSSRMVGLKDYGEAGWACEQLYNARLADDPRVDPSLREFTVEALAYLSDWIDAIDSGVHRGHLSDPIVRAAEAMRQSGRRLPIPLPEAAPAEVEPAPAPAPEAAAEPSPAPLPILDAVELHEPESPIETRPSDEPAAFPPLDLGVAAGLAAGAALPTLTSLVPDLPSASDLDLPPLPSADLPPAAAEPEPALPVLESLPELPLPSDGLPELAEPIEAFEAPLEPLPEPAPAPQTPAEPAEPAEPVAFELDLHALEAAEPAPPDPDRGPRDIPQVPEVVELDFDAADFPTAEPVVAEEPQPLPEAWSAEADQRDLQAVYDALLGTQAPPEPAAAEPSAVPEPLALQEPQELSLELRDLAPAPSDPTSVPAEAEGLIEDRVDDAIELPLQALVPEAPAERVADLSPMVSHEVPDLLPRPDAAGLAAFFGSSYGLTDEERAAEKAAEKAEAADKAARAAARAEQQAREAEAQALAAEQAAAAVDELPRWTLPPDTPRPDAAGLADFFGTSYGLTDEERAAEKAAEEAEAAARAARQAEQAEAAAEVIEPEPVDELAVEPVAEAAPEILDLAAAEPPPADVAAEVIEEAPAAGLADVEPIVLEPEASALEPQAVVPEPEAVAMEPEATAGEPMPLDVIPEAAESAAVEAEPVPALDEPVEAGVEAIVEPPELPSLVEASASSEPQVHEAPVAETSGWQGVAAAAALAAGALAAARPEAAEPLPSPEPLVPAESEPVVAGAGATDAGPEAGEEPVKIIGPLRIGIPLFNIFLNEADEQSRRLVTELAEWAHEHRQRPVSESAVALAHSLAGNSATVGYVELSSLARSLEHALMRSQACGIGRDGEPELFCETSEEIRRLLHQFAAGFLKPVPAELVERLADHERWPMVEPPTDSTSEPPPELVHAEPPAPPAPQPAPPVAAVAAPLADDEPVDAIDPDLLPIFEEEAEELLPQLQQRMREWIASPSDRSHPEACLRTLHTFKGGARLAGAMRAGEAAHRLESAIEHLLLADSVAAHEVEPLQARVDQIVASLEALRHPAAPQAPVAPVAPVVPAPVAAPAAVEPAAEPALDIPLDDLSAAPAAPATPAEASLPAEPASAVAAPPPAEAEPAPELPPAARVDWSRFSIAAASEAPQDAAATPGAGSAAGAVVRVRTSLIDRLVNEAGEVSITRARIESDVRQLQGSLHELTGSLERMRRELRDIEVQAETQITSRIEAAKQAAQEFDPLEMDRFTRLQELTRMMAESVNDVATLQRSLQRTLQSTEDQLAAQSRLTRELQDDLLRTRMVDFDTLSERLHRVVRQAAKDTGKLVRLDITGGSIEVDRGVLDRMVGPFEHLLRNAVAHGIEMPEVREAAGKDRQGVIAVRVTQSGNEVGVEFSDDGAGLDLRRIRERGFERGLLAAGAEPGDAELSNLIFVPGFTTAATVTELAGRGIGMDVVRAEVNGMGGRIETSTRSGQGTSFRLVLPLTTAVTQVVMLRCGELSVAVPSTLIEVVRRVPTEEVRQAYEAGSIEVGGETVPFYWLASLLQGNDGGHLDGRTQSVAVIRSAAQRVALHVDEVAGNQEVVVKHLGPQLSRMPGLAGVSLLPSGSVALIYNPVALAALYGDELRARRATRTDVAEPVQPAEPEAPPAPLVMVVDDSLTVRRVTQRLLEREGYRVLLAKDGIDALERLVGELPVVILCDIEMPRMDGFEFVRHLRADAERAAMPVIMITSRIAQKHRDHAAQLGVAHYLGKPFSEERLLELVADYARTAAHF